MADRIPVYTTESQERIDNDKIPGIEKRIPTAKILLEKWLSKKRKNTVKSSVYSIQPIYVRPPHITAAKRPAWAMGEKNKKISFPHKQH